MINVLFNIDKNYIDYCKMVMRSILEHTKSDVMFYIIGGSEQDFEGFNVICLRKPDISIIKAKTEFGHITECACYRLFAPLLLPNLDKVIYLDCDTIVLDDIQSLWDYDIKYIGGVQDPMCKKQADKNNLKHLYINSGVMVLNLKNLRKLDYLKIIQDTQEKGYNLGLLDQDIINIAFSDKIEHLPFRWNVYSEIYPQTTYGMIEARENPSIIHWCGPRKPWNYDVWQADKWRQYGN